MKTSSKVPSRVKTTAGGRALYAFVPEAAWEVRDKILSEMQRRGASLEKVKKIIGPEPPRIKYGLLQGPMPKIGLEPGEQWSEEWAKRASVAFEEYKTRKIATFRQAYRSFMGEGEDPEPPNHRTLEVKDLIEGAALHLLGHTWNNIAPGHHTQGDDLQKAADARRKAVVEFLKWTRLDPASIARNTAAPARKIIREIETWQEQGNELTEDDQNQLAQARSELAQLSTGIRPTEPRNAVGRPKTIKDNPRVVELRNAGNSWATLATKLKMSPSTAHRMFDRLTKTPADRK